MYLWSGHKYRFLETLCSPSVFLWKLNPCNCKLNTILNTIRIHVYVLFKDGYAFHWIKTDRLYTQRKKKRYTQIKFTSNFITSSCNFKIDSCKVFFSIIDKIAKHRHFKSLNKHILMKILKLFILFFAFKIVYFATNLTKGHF